MKKTVPFIGVTSDVRANPLTSFPPEPIMFLAQRYTQALLSSGALPLVLPLGLSRPDLAQLLDRIDGILVTGGNFDVHPRFYGEDPAAALGEIKDERTEFELELITGALDRDMAVLGICGGEQAINVALGGTLYQDIRTQLPHALEHELGSLRADGGHSIHLTAGTRLHAIVMQDVLNVNTSHHQSVKQLGRGLALNAASEDGVIEGIESANHRFVVGVQWHPERLMKERSQQRIFSAFVSACSFPHP
ncbi:MAG: gamma-glutamyl-gamma-aminobutyrate hydrolase family protein [Candidatus Binatia bacterium]